MHSEDDDLRNPTAPAAECHRHGHQRIPSAPAVASAGAAEREPAAAAEREPAAAVRLLSPPPPSPPLLAARAGLAAHAALLLAAALAGCAAVDQLAADVEASVTGQSTVVGVVEVTSPMVGVVSCFKGVQGSAVSRVPISNISQAQGFPALIVTRSGVVASGRCDELQKLGLLVPPAAAGGAGAGAGAGAVAAKPADYKSYAQTELAGIFERHPQPGGGKTLAWPRVAITLLDAPPWGWQKLDVRNSFKLPGSGCWTFKAKVWESERKSRDVGPFHRCTDERIRTPGGDSHAHYETWSGLVGSGILLVTPGSTGIQRTEGPNWPDTPLPVGRQSTAGRYAGVTFTGEVIAGILYATGIDFRQPDHRLWLNVAPAVEPK